jgi:hypothetical protein
MPIFNRMKSAWNAFRSSGQETIQAYGSEIGPGSSYRPDKQRSRYSSEKTIVTSIYNRIAIDVAGVVFRHIQLDDQHRYSDDVDSPLNACLTLEPNLDQGPRQFRQDIAMTLFDEGCAVIVPVDSAEMPDETSLIDIYTLRVGKVCQWYPKHVRISLYNEATGVRQEIILEKRFVAIVENPLYSVMNEPNSTLQRLIRKLNMLDAVDEASSSGKLDLIIQLPYVIKSEARKQQAEQRRTDIEFQLKGSQYGIAYTDGTEKITQLNRPAENNLLKQIEYLVDLLYSQLGITAEVMNGTADEATMLNYFNRTIEPIVDASTEAMQRAFLGPIGTKKGQRIKYFRDPFKFVPLANIAEIADKFTRNEILSSNEIRGYMGIPPSKDPKADQLVNSNMPQPPATPPGPSFDDMDSVMNEVFDGLNSDIDKLGKAATNGAR